MQAYPKKLVDCESLTATDLVTAIPELVPGVKEFTLVSYSTLVTSTKILSRQHAKPDWLDKLHSYDESLLRAAIGHQSGRQLDEVMKDLLSHATAGEQRKTLGTPDDEGRFGTPAENLTAVKLQETYSQLCDDHVLAIESPCLLDDGSDAHVPMIAFCCKPHKKRIQIIKSALREMGQEWGVLLESGRSYHYYGFDLLEGDAWIDFVGKCALCPYVDARYLGHRLRSRRFCLRITSSRNAYKRTEPYVVEWL